jgi:hypothetical protein
MQSEIQFANRRAFPVHAEYGADHEWTSTGIGFEEYSRMQTSVRAVAPGRQLETPSWAVNDAQLRELLVAFLEERAFNGRTGQQTGTLTERLANAQKRLIAMCEKTLVPTIDRLCQRLVSLKRGTPLTQDAQKQIQQLENQIENLDTRLRFEQKDGGASLTIGVAFYYFRVGLDSVGTAERLGIKPPHARQIVWRLRNTWAKLEGWRLDPSSRPVPKTPKPKPELKPKRPPVDIQRAAELLAQRHTLKDAAMLLGVSRGCLRAALTKAGLRQPRFQKKKVISRQQATQERYVAVVERLASANGGKIPTCGWLRANGYGLTYVFLRKHADWFAHLARDRAKTGPKAYPNTFNAERAVQLYRMGMSVSRIALMFGYPPQHGNNRVRRALIVAGGYPAANKKPGHDGPAVADCGAASAVVNRPIIQQDNLALAEQDK